MKIERYVEDSGGEIAATERALGLPRNRLVSWISRGQSPSLQMVQELASVTRTPVCYWADDTWPVGQPDVVPAHYRGRRYAPAASDDGRVGDPRGAGFAAEPTSATLATGLTEDEALALIRRCLELLEEARRDGVEQDALERLLVRELRQSV